ncbi:MAG: hypothetical protein ABL986_19305 [Vicinamibacterales bacterium]
MQSSEQLPDVPERVEYDVRVVRVIVDSDRRQIAQFDKVGRFVKPSFDSVPHACALRVNELLSHVEHDLPRYQHWFAREDILERARTFDVVAIQSVCGMVRVLADTPDERRLTTVVLRWLRHVRGKEAEVRRLMEPLW